MKTTGQKIARLTAAKQSCNELVRMNVKAFTMTDIVTRLFLRTVPGVARSLSPLVVSACLQVSASSLSPSFAAVSYPLADI